MHICAAIEKRVVMLTQCQLLTLLLQLIYSAHVSSVKVDSVSSPCTAHSVLRYGVNATKHSAVHPIAMKEVLEGKHNENPETLERVTCCKSFETASARMPNSFNPCI